MSFWEELKEKEIKPTINKVTLNPNKRVLIIGLGGTGTDALVRTKSTIIKRFNIEGEIPDNIGFLGIDTDRNVLNTMIGGASINPKNEFLHLEDPAINAKITNKAMLADFYTKWMNPALQPPSSVGTGAAGMRQLGRYLLMFGYENIKSKIQSKITAILNATPRVKSPVQIVIFSGISGGTGSGTFIDIGYIIRNIDEQLYRGAGLTSSTAYLFLPDVNLANPGLPQNAHHYIKSNGYAALKELDYLMGLEDKQQANQGQNDEIYADKYAPIYDTNNSGFPNGVSKAPFDSVYLISNIASPNNPIKNGYEYALNIASESIVNHISQDIKNDEAGMNMESVDVNGAQMSIGNTILKSNNCPVVANYKYKIIGAASTEIPIYDISNYIASKLLVSVERLKTNIPNSEGIANFLKATKAVTEDLSETVRISAGIGMRLPGDNIVPDDMMDDRKRSMFEQQLATYFAEAVKKISNAEFMNAIYEKSKENIENELFKTFTDINKGPFYANCLLIGFNKDDNIYPGIIDISNEICTKILTDIDETRNNKEKLALTANQTLSDAKNCGLFQNKKKRELLALYKKYRIETTLAELNINILEEIRKFYVNNLPGFLINLNRNTFDIYVKILDTLQEKFNKDTEYAQNIQTTESINGREYSWNIINLNDLTPKLDAMFNSKNTDDIVQKFLNNMVSDSKEWLSSDTDKIATEIEDFLNNEYSNVLNLNMETILGPDFMENKMYNRIQLLDNQSTERFPKDPLINVKQLCSVWNAVSVPDNSPRINEIMTKYISDNNLNTPTNQSRLTDKIFWLKVSIGVPVFLYMFLKDYEKEYENPSNQKIGIHLYETKTENWLDLPALIPEEFWKYSDLTPYNNDRVKQINTHARTIFRSALEKNIITDNNNYYCKLTDKNTIKEYVDSILTKYGITNIESCAADATTIENCIMQLKEIDTESIVKQEYVIANTSRNTQNNEDIRKEIAEDAFLANPKLVKIVAEEINKLDYISETIKTLDSLKNNLEMERHIYNGYIHARLADTITKSKDNIDEIVYIKDNIATNLCNIFGKTYIQFEIFKSYTSKLDQITINEISEAGNEYRRRKLNENPGEFLSLLENFRKNLDREFDEDISRGAADEIKLFYRKTKLFTDELIKYTRNSLNI